jgi:hypothetical protein
MVLVVLGVLVLGAGSADHLQARAALLDSGLGVSYESGRLGVSCNGRRDSVGICLAVNVIQAEAFVSCTRRQGEGS